MGDQIKILLLLAFLTGGQVCIAQRSACNYSHSEADSASHSSEACVYQKLFQFSSTDTLARQIITKVLNLISLPLCFAVERCPGINTCRAYVHDNGVRYIFYDDSFIRTLGEANENNWSLIAVLAHEMGHHLIGHTLQASDDKTHRRCELEADKFAGAMLARMNADTTEALLSLHAVSHPSCELEYLDPYPCYEHRRAAVLSGFYSIKPASRDPSFLLSKDLDKIDISGQFPVRDQGQEASVVGFTMAYAMEYELKQKYNLTTQISPRYIYNGVGGTSYSGATIESALTLLLTKGAVEENVWPYRAGDYDSLSLRKADTSVNHYKIRAYRSVPRNVDSFRLLLKDRKAIIVGCAVSEEALHTVSGVIPVGKASFGNISICIVGFDDNTRLFKFKNSWGTNWGDKGYGYIRYQDLNLLLQGLAYVIDL